MRIGIPFGAPHPSLGEVIVLCAVAIQGHTLKEEDILEFLRGKLSTYKLPKKILLFGEGDLSFTGNQKIQSGKLIDRIEGIRPGYVSICLWQNALRLAVTPRQQGGCVIRPTRPRFQVSLQPVFTAYRYCSLKSKISQITQRGFWS